MMLLLCACGHEHTWSEATCTTPKTCTECGETEGEVLGHTWVEATCTEPKTCSVCGATEGEALGHTWVEATCIEPKTCSVCGATEGEALGHTWVEATCIEPKTCSVCGATEEDALGHTWVEATCTEPKTCSVCGATEGDALGHTWVEANFHSPKTCSICGATEGEKKANFFEENSFPIEEYPASFTAKAILAIDNSDNPTKTEIIDVKYNIKTYTIIPSTNRTGYKTIKLIIDGVMLVVYHENSMVELGTLVDYYTGYKFTGRNTSGDDTLEIVDTITIDDTKYTIYYLEDVSWKDFMPAQGGKYEGGFVLTYLIDIPEEYDGMVIRFEDIDKWIPFDEFDEIISGDYIEKTDSKGYNFRIGIQ